MSPVDERRKLDAAQAKVFKSLLKALPKRRAVVVVRAPPGSGKTYLLVEAVAAARADKMRVAVATQTNAQADEVCLRLAERSPGVKSCRFLGSGDMERAHAHVTCIRSGKDLPNGSAIVVATTSKWEFNAPTESFDVVLVDEAWQMPWSRFMGLGNIASRFVLIGDPGQIPPVVTVDASRWETAPRPPHHAAPDLILRDPSVSAVELELPASRRLPHDTVQLVKSFYDFDFGAYSGPGERRLEVTGPSRDGIDRSLDLLSAGSACGLTLPCPEGSPPFEVDDAVASTAVEVAQRVLRRNGRAVAEDRAPGSRVTRLKPEHIGIAATHRVMNARIAEFLPLELAGVRVDTPERWQGLERPLMIVVHPLSGVLEPSSFDLETGRLCVMASRHSAGLVVLGRDHIRRSLEEYTPSADQPVGQPDVNGRGHAQHLGFWKALEAQGCVVSS